MRRIETYELIERYLKNQLSAEELVDIENRILNEPEFASEVEAHRQLQQLIIDHSFVEVKEKLYHIRQHRLLQNSSKNKRLRNSLFGGPVLIVLTVALLLVLRNKKTVDTPEPIVNIVTNNETSRVPKTVTEENTSTTVINRTETVENEIPVSVNLQKSPVIITEGPESKIRIVSPVPVGLKNETGMDNNLIGNKPEISEPPVVLPCNIQAEIVTEPSCNNRATGVIEFRENSITGGIPPFRVSLNGLYSDSLRYANLFPGTYNVVLADSKNCTKEWKQVSISRKDCFSDFKFAPAFGEEWEIPLEQGKPGEIKIFNRNGFNVYTIKFDGLTSLTWNGVNTENEELPGGVYPFEIKYTDGTIFRGTVTVVR